MAGLKYYINTWLTFRNLNFRKFLPLTDECLVISACLWKQCGLCWTTSLLPGIWNLVMFQAWCASMIRFQERISEHRVSNELPRLTTLHKCHNSSLGNLRVSCCNFMGRRLLEMCAWFSPEFIPCCFSICWLCFISFCCKKS